MNILKTILISLFTVVVLVGSFYMGIQYQKSIESNIAKNINKQQDKNIATTATPTVTIPPSTSTPVVTSVPTPTTITWTDDQLARALSVRTGIPVDQIEFSVGTQLHRTGKVLIRGTVKRKGEQFGGSFFGVVTPGHVNITYDGQGVPQCSEVNPYGYPTSWADYCIDSSGKTVKR